MKPVLLLTLLAGAGTAAGVHALQTIAPKSEPVPVEILLPGPAVGPASEQPYIWTPENGIQPPPPIPPIPSLQRGVLLLVRSDRSLPTKDPLWRLQLVANNKVIAELPALTGRADRQSLDRNQAGRKAPLPPGRYSIVRKEIERGPFADPEVGTGWWIPIQPLFSTNRSLLGIHHDPSWGKSNGESGTSGCVGLETAAATDQLATLIEQYDVKELIVVN